MILPWALEGDVFKEVAVVEVDKCILWSFTPITFSMLAIHTFD